jgi:hypothetical protein
VCVCVSASAAAAAAASVTAYGAYGLRPTAYGAYAYGKKNVGSAYVLLFTKCAQIIHLCMPQSSGGHACMINNTEGMQKLMHTTYAHWMREGAWVCWCFLSTRAVPHFSRFFGAVGTVGRRP